jgi:predicted RNA binding protein YcfA (HicA-like mRNA interferase family)
MKKDDLPSVSIPVHGSKDLPIGLCNALLKNLGKKG